MSEDISSVDLGEDSDMEVEFGDACEIAKRLVLFDGENVVIHFGRAGAEMHLTPEVAIRVAGRISDHVSLVLAMREEGVEMEGEKWEA